MIEDNKEEIQGFMVIERTEERKPTCGIIMPISELDGLSAQHWEDVLNILIEVATEAGFETKLVSDAEEVGIIQKRIVQNVYNSDIVICDVSAKNPNVMFELGMRLAFDKAAVIIKDDATNYSFDTSPIEHLGYPRDLRFTKIVAFKKTLKNKLLATLKKSKEPNHSMYLNEFGEFVVAKLEKKEVSTTEFLVKEMQEMKEMINLLNRKTETTTNNILNESQRQRLKTSQIDNVYTTLIKKYFKDNKIEIIDNAADYEKFSVSLLSEPTLTDLFNDKKELASFITSKNPFI